MITKPFQDYALLAKMFGVVAAVASLLFLVIEAIETSETNARVIQEGIASLNEAELHQYMTTRISLWNGFENAYFEHQKGVLEDTDWSRFYVQICKYFIIETETWEGISYRGGVASTLTPEFRLYTENSCQ